MPQPPRIPEPEACAASQGLLFALATVLLVVASTYYFLQDWLPPLASDRAEIDAAIAITLLVTGLVFIVTNLMLAYFGWRFQDHAGARSAYMHDNPKLEWTWTLITAGIMFLFLFGALGLWAKVKSRAARGRDAHRGHRPAVRLERALSRPGRRARPHRPRAGVAGQPDRRWWRTIPAPRTTSSC